LKLIISQCGVKIPSASLEHIRSLKQNDANQLTNFLGQTIPAKDFKEQTQALASNLAQELQGETLNIMHSFNTGNLIDFKLVTSCQRA